MLTTARIELRMDAALQVINEILGDLKRKTSPTMSDADFLEVFSAEQVLRYLRLTPSSLEDGITGDGDDGGIDAAYIFVNGRLITGDVKPEDFEHYKKNVALDWVII